MYAMISAFGLLGYGAHARGLFRRPSLRLARGLDPPTRHASRPDDRAPCAFAADGSPPPSHPRLSSPLAAFLLALHDAGASGEDVFADSDHADFISREAFTRENPNERDALARDRVIPRLAERHHASHRVRHDSHDRPRTSIADDSSDPFDANPDLPRRESVEDRHDADPSADPFGRVRGTARGRVPRHLQRGVLGTEHPGASSGR